MPKIPQYQPAVGLGGIPSGRSATAADFGGDMGLSQASSALDKASNTTQIMAQKQQEREATAFVAEQTTALQLRQMQRLREMQTEDGDINTFSDRYKEELEKDIEAISVTAPNGLAKDSFKLKALQLQGSLMEKASAFEAMQRVSLQKQSIANSIDSLANAAFLEPEGYEDYKAQAASIIESSKRIFTPAEIAELSGTANETLAISRVRAEIERNPYEAKGVLQDFSDILKPNTMISLSNMSDNKIDTLERKEIAARQRRLKLFTDDPAQLAIESGASTPEAIIEKQRQLGVAEGNLSVIPKERAAFISNQLEGAKNSTELLDQLQNIREQVGDENYNIAMKDLKKSGLSSRIELLSVMNPTQDRGVMDAAFAMAKDGDEVRKRAFARRKQMPDATTQKIREEIGGELSDALEVLALENNDQAQVASFQESMTDIALYFIAQGQDVSDATKNATKWFNDKVVTAEINDRKFRVPQDYRPNEIERNLKALIKQTKLDNIPAINQDLQNEATPVLHPDEKRYYLVDAIGQPIANNDKIIYFDVKDILQRGKEVKAEREQKIFDENLKKLMQ